MLLGSKEQKRISSSKGGSILALEGEENLLQADGVVATGSKPDDVVANVDEQKVYEEDVDIKSPRAQTANSK